MSKELDPQLFDDLFHAMAWQAYLEEAALQGATPDSQATQRRAYRLFEEALAARRDSPSG